MPEDLPRISAHDSEDGARIRANPSCLEVALPLDLLRRVTLVDTPGLDADNDVDARVTIDFQSRADAVLWLCAYASAATKVGSNYIKSVPPGIKLLPVVNQIDQHDPDTDGSLDDYLKTVGSRLGTAYQPVGISAKWAAEALLDNRHDPDLLERSRWSEFQLAFENQTLTDGKQLRPSRVARRTLDTVQQLGTLLRGEVQALRTFHLALSYADQRHRSLEREKAALEGVLKKVGQPERDGIKLVGGTCRLPETLQDRRFSQQRDRS